MTASINLEETYNELSNLLKDVCSFLNKEVQNGTLSTAAASHAQKLVQRLKEQEEVVSKISALQESTNSNYPYLQMQRPSLVEEPLSEYVDADSSNIYEEEEYEETENYAEVSIPPVTSVIIEDVCPFLDLPLSMLAQEAVKCGPLIRKERIFIIEQKKQLFVGLVGYWLLIYSVNKKDMKPIQTVNVTDYRAFAKKDPVFEIICENKKTHEFIAKSAKDMDQWVVAINCKKQPNPLYARNLPSVPAIPEKVAEETDSFDGSTNTTNNIIEADPEDIYENVDDIRRADSIKVNTSPPVVHDSDDDAPTLPARQQTHYQKRSERSSVESSTYNNVTPMEEEDDIYDPVQNGQIEEEEEELYDEPRMAETVETFNTQVKLPADKNTNRSSLPTEKKNLPHVEINKQMRLTFDLRKNKPSPPVLESNDYDNEEEEDSYDIPRSDNFNNQQKSQPAAVNNNDEYEDEEVDYDEMKIIPQNNNVKVEKPKPSLNINNTPEQNKVKPVITSPKPNLQEGKKKIHNLIQQMEANLTLKGKK